MSSLATEPPPTSPASERFVQEPASLSYYQLEDIKRQAAENTERFRTRIQLPADASGLVTAVTSNTHSAAGSDPTSAPESAPTPSPDNHLSTIFGSLLVIASLLLLVRKLAPDLSGALRSWTSGRVLLLSSAAGPTKMHFSEDRLIEEFQAALGSNSRAQNGPANGQTADAEPFAVAATQVREIHRLLTEAARNVQAQAQRKLVLEALRQVSPLMEMAKPAEWLAVRQMACALEMFLKQLAEKTGNLTSSTLRTATMGATLLEELCRPDLNPHLLSEPPLRILVVDDEIFSRNALSFSLKRGLMEPEVAESGETALAMASRHAYDLIFMDVMMPGMDGFEICSKIHSSTLNRTTPVVFVTALRDFDTRAQSIVCGGRDIIAKPFLTFELTVKALTLIVGERLRGRGRLAETQVTPEPAETVAANSSKSVEPQPREIAPATATALTRPPVELKSVPAIPASVCGHGSEKAKLALTTEFFARATQHLEVMQNSLQRLHEAPDQNARQEIITNLLMQVHSFAVSAEDAQQQSLSLVGAALEGLLLKLLQNVAHLTTSALETVEGAAALIQELCFAKPNSNLAFVPPIRALVVDDDPVALRAISMALQLRLPQPASAPDGKTALELAAVEQFDVIFVDLEMPGIHGTEVCAQIRQGNINARAPIVFVTNHQDPEIREKCMVTGGNDYITKPYLSSELSLKALTFALRNRLGTYHTVAPTRAESIEKPRNNVARLSELDMKRRADRKKLGRVSGKAKFGKLRGARR